MSIRLLRNPFKRTVVANSEDAPVTQDDTRLTLVQSERPEDIEAEAQAVKQAAQAVADFGVALQRADKIRRLTIDYDNAIKARDKAVRLHRRSAEEQKAVEVAFHRLFEAKREALRDAQS